MIKNILMITLELKKYKGLESTFLKTLLEGNFVKWISDTTQHKLNLIPFISLHTFLLSKKPLSKKQHSMKNSKKEVSSPLD